MSSLTSEKGLVPEIHVGGMYLWMEFARPSPAFCSNLTHAGRISAEAVSCLPVFFCKGMGNPSSAALRQGAQIHSLASASSKNRLDFDYHPSVALVQCSCYITAGIVLPMTTSKTRVVEPAQKGKKKKKSVDRRCFRGKFFCFQSSSQLPV